MKGVLTSTVPGGYQLTVAIMEAQANSSRCAASQAACDAGHTLSATHRPAAVLSRVLGSVRRGCDIGIETDPYIELDRISQGIRVFFYLGMGLNGSVSVI